ncbi:phosphatase PAP2 family protein [Marinobacter sp. NP-4(2019)]|uniref:bifunctional DedA family/phosphatase PAP2 family protein n=1 Tax=Marinobacter sp. NP-4(2019) TaxID=2488665 RepID=UPI000FC3E766|nr:bifunctional DedA family/phosphatase PAP2 family protein [Marinobacter sp. NP-4(2019)]AZT82961.1 phosphatase PAP2 family protein [Marinobacter sp. NP-4(2019)]
MSGDWLASLSAWLTNHSEWLAMAIFATAFAESLAIAGIVIPGVAIIFAVAALAGQIAMPLTEALLWAAMGAILGDCISFALGRLCQGKLDRIWPLSRYPKAIHKGEYFFHRYGGVSVVIGRFVGPIRPVIPLVAGALMMPWRRFLLFNLTSAVGWAPVYVIPGYLVGSALASDIQPPAHFYPVIAISMGTLIIIYLTVFRFQLGLGYSSRLYRWLARKMEQYDTTHRFWRLYSSERPAQAGEFPLPSLSLAIAATALFLIWSQLVTGTTLLQPLDSAAASWFSQLRQPLFDPTALLFTLAGETPVLVVAGLFLSLALVFRGYYGAALHIIAAVALTTLLVWLFKTYSAIPRPELVQAPPASGAFPSGHTTGITVFCMLVANFVARETRHRKRWRAYLVFSLPIPLVAISRLYLGVHWFTDVVGGFFLGLAITGYIRASYSRYDRVPLSRDLTLMTAIIIWGGFTAAYIWHQWEHALTLYAPTGL